MQLGGTNLKMTFGGRGIDRFATHGSGSGRGRGGSSSSHAPLSSNGSSIGASAGNVSLSGTASASEGEVVSPMTLSHSLIPLTIDGVLGPGNKVPAHIYKSFKKVRNSKGYNWRLTPDSVKISYWEEFKKVFTWDST